MVYRKKDLLYKEGDWLTNRSGEFFEVLYIMKHQTAGWGYKLLNFTIPYNLNKVETRYAFFVSEGLVRLNMTLMKNSNQKAYRLALSL